MSDLWKDLSETAKQIDQWFSKLVSLVPKKIYAPLKDDLTKADNAQPLKNVNGGKRKTQKANGVKKTKKKKLDKPKTIAASVSSPKEQRTSDSAATQDNSKVADMSLDPSLQAALAKTRGEKITDDPKILKRRWKERERKKRKSRREWAERKRAQEEKQKLRQQRREQNIQKRKAKRTMKTKKSR